ncbi:hypothetical protein [Sporocytophaga myxococcoides]|uniref:hypothetical protein n=1 Tax=Sporocytophaga myxococcoides TaxID=153721 RepID=UPI0012DC9C8A|nr:hypothetical protein [Sporocytophaga myxococcoides]
MRRIFYSMVIFSLVLGSCSTKGRSRGRSYMNTKGVNKGNITASSSTKKQQDAEESNVDSDGYAYSFSRTRINFQGASGMGMGGSYASTFFAGEDKKIAAEKKHPSKPLPTVKKSYNDTTAYIQQSYPETDSAYSSSNKDADTSSYKQEWQQYNW